MKSTERKNMMSKIKKTAKEVAKDSNRAKELLIKAGICTNRGTLRTVYKPYKPCK